MVNCKNTFIKLIVTCFFIGKIKYAPGTFGSLLAFPVTYLITWIVLLSGINFNMHSMNEYQNTFFTITIILLIVIFILFLIGVYCSSIYSNEINVSDPKDVVIDELVGQMLVIACSSFSAAFIHYYGIGDKIGVNIVDFIFLFLMPFVLFRFFDIVKPFPVDLIDKNIKGGIGIMLDDIAAAILAIVTQYAITFAALDIYGRFLM